jgi:hypothetical protein
MIANEEFLKEFIEKYNVDPLIGSPETNSEKYFVWFDHVKDKTYGEVKIKDFDINSAIQVFDDDLYEYYEKFKDEFK